MVIYLSQSLIKKFTLHILQFAFAESVTAFEISFPACSDVSIVGGTDVKKKKKLQPCMVSIQKDQIHVCGGILIQNQWGLTSAHCKDKGSQRVDDIMLIKQNLKKIPKKEKDVPPGTKCVVTDMLCAGSMQEKRSTCWGDSGGPLECKKNIVGVESGSRGCGIPKKPTVYTFFLRKTYPLDQYNILKKQFNSTTV
uniref:Peptidase S1 domain-containing protein n=1 Tax=Sinocyclocheilus rhinocerous TaxID=307959 RepID=A0A673IX85_9TELE